jgi:CTP synthase (UTP-ammonia lyase)
LYRVLKTEVFTGYFNCNYGVNPRYQKQLQQEPLIFTAFSHDGEVRALELNGHPFFKGTLFQPPLDSSPQKPNALVMDFIQAVSRLTV